MTMQLYFHPMSGNSRRVLLTATHLNVPVERHVIDLQKGEQRLPPHLGRNPNGKVPVLVHGDLHLWESRAIMQYLADSTPGQTVLPTDAAGRADVTRWMFWDAAHFAQALAVIVSERFVKPLMKREPDATELARGEALFASFAPVLDEHLATRTWVAQNKVTLADFSLASGLALAGPAKIPVENYAHIRAWLGRVQELDAWQKTAPQK